jgi:hypothetical protein
MFRGRLLARPLSGLCALLSLAAYLGCANGGTVAFDGPNTQTFAGDDGGPSSAADGGPCIGLACQQMTCPDGLQTTVSGIVYTPSTYEADPIYNALVYVPNSEVEPFAPGVTCDRCGAVASGSPLTAALSGPDGHFVVSNVPVGDDIPVVIQVGRWRRKFLLPTVMPCRDNPIPAGLTHLPRNHLQGEMPRIAIATGAVDPLECLLRKIGIDDSEFTTPTGSGRVHVYTSNGAMMPEPTPPASELWSSAHKLDQYDIVLLPCEGKPIAKPASALQNLIDYTSSGGRVFTTHYGYVWIEGAPGPFSTTAAWAPDQEAFPDTLSVDVNTSFPKGQAMSQWLSDLGALDAQGQLTIDGSRRDATQTKGGATSWLTSSAPDVSLQEYTFNTPVNAPAAEQCGRVSFSDFHVTADGLDSTSLSTFPTECVDDSAALTPQEQVIEFMLFDLASCIQLDTDPTPVPR